MAQPLPRDTRRRFPLAGILFEKYNATVKLSTGATETLIPSGEGITFPLGTVDIFVTHGAPANLIETVNTVGLPIYARQIARPDGSAIEVKTEVIQHQSPWRSLEAVEVATMDRLDWYDNRRLLAPIGDIPPAEAEAKHYAALVATLMAA